MILKKEKRQIPMDRIPTETRRRGKALVTAVISLYLSGTYLSNMAKIRSIQLFIFSKNPFWSISILVIFS